MQDITVVEEWITTKDGCSIYTKSWKTTVQPPLATVIFLHGFGEHVNRYDHVFSRFAQADIEVYAYDQRGFGQTGVKNRNLGITGGWKVIQEDITDAIKVMKRPGVPLILFGHSMGGHLALRYAVDGSKSQDISGFLITAPLLRTHKVSDTAVTLGTALSKILPNWRLNSKVDAKHVSHDQEECIKYENDTYISGYWCLKGASDVFNGSKMILKSGYKKIAQPIYMAHGSSDQVTCFGPTKELYDKIPSADKTFREWPGLFHELHNEVERYQIIQEYIDWIVSRAIRFRPSDLN